ncbi:MAG: SDR family oxidoreductase [Phycisphaerales bacterium]
MMNANTHDNLSLLVLGASGMVGTAVEAVCSQRGIPCVCPAHRVLDIISASQLTAALDGYRPTAVVNCVAIPSIEPCERDPGAAMDLHCVAVRRLAQECERRGIILVQPSSHAVFDGTKDGPYTEDDPVKATGVYGATKVLSERLAAACCSRHYIPRFPTLYGPRRNSSMGFVDKVIGWLTEGRQLRIADDRMDTPTYSMDAAAAVVAMIVEKAPWGVFHVANAGWISYYDFVVKLKTLLRLENEIVRCKEREFASACYKPLRTGLTSVKRPPLRSLDAALREYVEARVAGTFSRTGVI